MSADEKEPQKERQNTLEELESRLYSRTPPPLRHDEEFSGEEQRIRIAPGWTAEAERKQSALYGVIATVMPWLKRLFIASLIFFLFAAGIALFGLWRGTNTVSPANISIEVSGPVGIGAGEELVIEVIVQNGNAIDLDSVDLLVEYPEGTKKPDNLTEPLLRYRDSLGPLTAGETASRQLTLVPFGEEGEEKTVAITTEYRPKDSNAIFSKKAAYAFSISSAPVALNVAIPGEVNNDQSFEIVLDVSSNSSATQEDILVRAQYPFGFEFAESEPSPSYGKDAWLLGDLNPQGRRTIRVKGKIKAQEEEERTFRFFVGTQSRKDEKQIGTVFLSETPTIAVRKAFVNLDLLVNGEKGKTFIARSGQTVRADILWENDLPVKITDLEITAKLLGDIHNPSSISASSGFYDSNEGTVTWNKDKASRFAVVEPGESGSESMSVALLSVATDPSAFTNPDMTIEVTARGRRLDEQGLRQDVVSSVTKVIKVATNLSLVSRLLHADGVFSNTGPIPPKAGEETTYTVVWSLSNTSNGVANAKVSAVLPSYVRFLGETEPSTEDLRFSPVGGELLWNVGAIEAGEGVGTPPREVSFRVGITPSTNQANTAPTLVGEAAARATDRFTGAEVQSNVRQPQTTGSLSDAGAGKESGRVAP